MNPTDPEWPLIPRELYLEQLRRGRGAPFIKVLTGIRRCGKSTILRMYMDELRSSGVPEENILYVDLDEDPEGSPRDAVELTNQVRGRLDPGRGTYLFIDEVQNVDGWEDAVLSFYDSGADVCITGSNSRMLSSELATRLSGRSLEIHVMPLAFSEYAVFRRGSGRSADDLLADYIRDGGMPAIALSEDMPSRALIPQMLEGIYSTVYRKDIEERYSIRGSSVLSNLIGFLMRNIGCRTSPRNIAGSLSSKGVRVTAPTARDYLGFVSDSYLMTRSERLDSSTMGYLETTDKFYATDLGVRNAIAPMRDGDMSGLIENVVFNELRYRYGKVVTLEVDGREVDFVADPMGRRSYYQVCMSIADDATRARELRPLREVGDGYPKTFVVYERYPLDEIEGIRMVRLVDWLLETDWFGERFGGDAVGYSAPCHLGRFSSGGRLYGYDLRAHGGRVLGTAEWCRILKEMGGEGADDRYDDSEAEPALRRMAEGRALGLADSSALVGLAHATLSGSPAGRLAPGWDDGSASRGRLTASYVRWAEDVLVTSDNPVVRCGLDDLSVIPSGGGTEVALFPVDPRTLVLLHREDDGPPLQRALGIGLGLVDPQRVNRIMIGGALRYVFSRDGSNPILSVIDRVPLDPGLDGARSMLGGDRPGMPVGTMRHVFSMSQSDRLTMRMPSTSVMGNLSYVITVFG